MFDDGSDLTVLKAGERYPVRVGPNLAAAGWKAGAWVRYVAPTDGVDLWFVEASVGVVVSGFLMYESEDYSDPTHTTYRNYTSYQNRVSNSGARVVTMIAGGGKYLFARFETVSLDAFGARVGPPITYAVGEALRISENGLLCNDPEARIILATGGTSAVMVGQCHRTPTATLNKLGLDMAL